MQIGKYLLIALAGAILTFAASTTVKNRAQPDTIAEAPLDLVQSDLLFQDVSGNEWTHMPPYQNPGDVTLKDSHLLFKNKSVTKDDWDYLYLDPKNAQYNWDDFSWQFKAIRNTRFREFAFNFRNIDFDNRYRYRFEDDKIFFDKKSKGAWVNNISSIPFEMSLDRPYSIRIDSIGSTHRCYVDGRLLLENVDSEFKRGSIAIILWEDDGTTRIEADVFENKVFKLSKP